MFDYEDFSEGRAKEGINYFFNIIDMEYSNYSDQMLTGSTTALDNLVSEVNSLNDKMKQEIIKIVKENGGLVRTDNPKCDPIYGFIFNEEFDQYEDRKIIAIATCEDNDLSILFGSKYITLDGMTNDDILECDEWEPVMAGMVIANATLLDICEKLEEYIDNMLNDEDIDE